MSTYNQTMLAKGF